MVQCHLTAALRGCHSQQLEYRWGVSLLNPKYVAWLMEMNLAGQHFVVCGGPSVPKRWVRLVRVRKEVSELKQTGDLRMSGLHRSRCSEVLTPGT